MKKIVTMILMALAATMVGAQDLTHYKRVIKELSSAKYQGRGYAKDGANKAGRFLQREFEKAGVDEVMLQPFKLDINTFCGKMPGRGAYLCRSEECARLAVKKNAFGRNLKTEVSRQEAEALAEQIAELSR